jgi:lipopolysaccharide/colanic/teichoic acid biosynthesis glycosyltransferase
LTLSGATILSPVLLVTAAAIRLSGTGPVLYRQTRVGLNGLRFTILKFRTMATTAEAGTGPRWATPDDPRCTRIGAWLRRSGIDELPQLWNVLCGDMSLIGPRPERPEFVERFRDEHENYDQRHRVPSGLTGYAQVHGWRGDTDLAARLRHDLYYVRHWSLALDLRLLLETLVHGWSERTRNGAVD